MSIDEQFTVHSQENGTYIKEYSDGRKEIITHEQLLEIVYQKDPLIAKAAEKLKRLSEDHEFVREYKEREEELRRRSRCRSD